MSEYLNTLSDLLQENRMSLEHFNVTRDEVENHEGNEFWASQINGDIYLLIKVGTNLYVLPLEMAKATLKSLGEGSLLERAELLDRASA